MVASKTVELGACPVEGGVAFALWTTRASRASVRCFDEEGVALRDHPLVPRGEGIFADTVAGLGPGALYKFVLDDVAWPDPYARALPFGVHGPAAVCARAKAPPGLRDAKEALRRGIYELHVGTFTEVGTFGAAIERLDHLVALGVGAIELMPISSFPGERGWGYDGVAHFAPYRPYGSADDLRRLIAEAHRRGLAVILDVVYNHFGPDGNYLGVYAPEYFGGHDTAWGTGPNFANSRMRAYVLGNVRMWFDEYGFDGLRLDATHAIVDDSTPHLLRELADVAATFEPPRLLIAEDERNDPTLVTELGMSAIWADDFHHQVRVLLAGDRDGYFAAFALELRDLARLIERGWLFEGQVSPFTGTPRGADAGALSPDHLVYCVQNHDQIGNRAFGTRLSHDASDDALLAATVLMMFLPAIPLIFMGQEWSSSSPFAFFSDHAGELGAAVTRGRREEFKKFAAFADPAQAARIPDPQATSTFVASKLRWDELGEPRHARALELHRAMFELRRRDPVIAASTRTGLVAEARGEALVVVRGAGDDRRLCVINFGVDEVAPFAPAGHEAPRWDKLVSTHEGGAVPRHGAVVLRAAR